MFRALLIGIALSLMWLPAVALAGNLKHIYAFGDSYSDNGAGYGVTRIMVAHGVSDAVAKPGKLYWQQRWSNGPVTVEVMARALKLPLSDYAIGGAQSGYDNYHSWMNKAWPTGTLAQVGHYLDAKPKGQADPKGLYFIFASANDFFAHEDFNQTISLDDLATGAAVNIQTAVKQLVAAGARHVVVVGSVDLTHVPAVTQRHDEADAATFQSHFDKILHKRLKAMAADQSLQMSWFDHVAFAKRVRAHAEQYGLTDVSTPCQSTYPQVGERCQNPAMHYYWDEWHPTHHIHVLAGRAIADQVREEQMASAD